MSCSALQGPFTRAALALHNCYSNPNNNMASKLLTNVHMQCLAKHSELCVCISTMASLAVNSKGHLPFMGGLCDM